MKLTLLFPGQGSQYSGMGKSLYEEFPEAKQIFDEANSVLGYDIKNKIFNSTEEELKQTEVTQPAIYIVSCAAFKALQARSAPLSQLTYCAAGHSLGEYSALFSSQVFDFQTGLKLVEYRGKFIQECCEKNPGTMAAILGMEKNDLQKFCLESANGGGVCEMVNFNSPGQIVAAGTKTAIAVLIQKLSGVSGTKGIPLNVSGAFHSALMRPAAEKMAQILESASLNDAKIPVITNCDAKMTSQSTEFKKKLSAQIDHPVLWENSIQEMIANNVDTFIEIGPGKVLSGLLRKIDRKKKCLNVEDKDSMNNILNELKLS